MHAHFDTSSLMFACSLKRVSILSDSFQGWCGSADPRKRGFQVRHVEAEDMKKEMEEQRQKKGEERQEINSGVSCTCSPSHHRGKLVPIANDTDIYFRLEWSWCHS